MQAPVGSPRKKTAAFLVAAAFALFALVDVIAFRTPLYRSVLDPSSTTGSFEAAIAQFRAFPAQPSRDVLVLGDSRTYSGLDPAAAEAGAGGKLRFLNAGVPGTTPRCWPFFVRAIDPEAHRYRAVVIPVDTFSDDDSAIGSLDGDDRPMDLRYVVFQTRLTDLPKLAGSFSDPRERIEYGIDLFWRGVELRDDFQSLAADPPARAAAIAQARRDPAYEPLAAHPRSRNARRPARELHRRHARLSVELDARSARRYRHAGLARRQAQPVVREIPAAMAGADRRALRSNRNARLLCKNPHPAGSSLEYGSAQPARWSRSHRPITRNFYPPNRSSHSSVPIFLPTRTISIAPAACSSAACWASELHARYRPAR